MDTMYKGSILLRAILSAVVVVGILLAILFGALSLADESGQFTVTMEQKSGCKLSLCENKKFDKPSSVISTEGIRKLANISGMSIGDDVDDGEGLHNGDNYFAYSFYIKNVGKTACKYNEKILIEDVTRNVDAVVRIRVYRDGVPTTYAKVGADGTPEYGTDPFPKDKVAVDETVTDFAPEQISKYTIVMWVEGDDPECLDSIKGGSVKMSMSFSAESEDTAKS